MNPVRECEDRMQAGVYPKRDLLLVRGCNAHVWDEHGREYIDCVAGNGSANIGHAQPAVAAAVRDQAERLVACANVFYNDARARFLDRLLGIAPAGMKRAFLCNSGTESVEAALKFARFATRRAEFVSAVNGFHGRTLGALSATHNPQYRDGFAPLVEGFRHVPFNRSEAVEAAVTDSTAAVILEVVQGEGGVHVGLDDYFRQVRDICTRKGALLIIDEVQTGFGRTGRMFAIQHSGVQADLICLAKSIAGGLPMGALLCRDGIDLPAGKHGSTFGGNPLCCAAGTAAIEFMLAEGLDRQAEEKGNYLLHRLNRSPLKRVREIRGLGLMIGLELREKVKPHLQSLMEAGVLALPAGASVLRLLPPLTISYEDLDRVADTLQVVLN